MSQFLLYMGMEVTIMKKIIRKFVMAAMAMAILFTNVSMVEASELKASDVTVYEKEADAVARAIKAYSFGRTKSSYTVGTMSVTSSSHFTIIMPNNNNRDFVQGTVYFIPMSGGTSINYTYGNYVMEDYCNYHCKYKQTAYYCKVLFDTLIGFE